MEVADDGVGGVDPSAGSGIRGLEDRVAAVGGTLEIDSPGWTRHAAARDPSGARMKRLAASCFALLLAGCGGTEVVREPGVQVSGSPAATPVAGAPVPDGAVRIAVVTHGPASSKFWAIIRNGVDSAARRLDVLVDYQSPDVFSVERMSELIDQAVATKPDGLVVSIPSEGLAPAIRRAVQAGIPVISINSGSDIFKRARRARPRRPDREPRRPGGGPAARRRGRAQRALPQPGDATTSAPTPAATGWRRRCARPAGARGRCRSSTTTRARRA